MMKVEKIEKLIKKIDVTPRAHTHDKTLNDALAAQEKWKNEQPANFQPNIWRIIMKNPMTKFATAAVIIIAVLSGINFWPDNSENGKWWLGPPAAWGQEILTAIETIEGVSCREQTFIVNKDGGKHLSSTWDILFVSKDRYRRDIYDGDTLREIQWYIPDGDTMLQHSIRFDLESYFVERHQGSFGIQDPRDRFRFYVQFINSAQQILGTKKIGNINCVGFEIKASEYGDNPENWVDQIWFDVETKLPVIIEQRARPVTNHPEITFTTVQDEFKYNDEFPEDTFIPYIPDGYIFGHPDEITPNRKLEK